MDAVVGISKGSVLIADADPAGRSLLQAALLDAGWQVLVAGTAQAALETLRARPVCAAILDLRLPDMNGPAWLQQARVLCPGLPVLAVAAAPTVEMAVEAMRAGACDVLVRPVAGRAVSKRLEALVPAGQAEPNRFGRCLTAEPTLAATLRQARQLAGSCLPVAICGAAGTGRRTLAASMHQANPSPRPITTVDLTILSPEQVRTKIAQLAETPNLALTVADAQCLKVAEQERLVALISAVTQAGGPVVVTLSDRPDRLAEKGPLSRSLAQSLSGGVLHLPPLAGRRVDLPLLAQQILAETLPHKQPAVSALAMEALVRYDWPGNIRQLRLVLERAGRLAGDGPIEPRHLPILQAVRRDPVPVGWVYGSAIHLQEIVDDVERNLIGMALRQTGQNQAKAAELLGVPRTTLREKLNKYGFLSGASRPA